MIINYEYKELDVNMSLVEVVRGLGVKNIVDGVKILKLKFGISYYRIAEIMGISRSALMTAIKWGTFNNVVNEIRLVEAIEELQNTYLGFVPTTYVVDAKGVYVIRG